VPALNLAVHRAGHPGRPDVGRALPTSTRRPCCSMRKTPKRASAAAPARCWPVHLYGQPCDLPRLAAVARRRGLVLLQDACQAHGAQHAGRPLTGFRRRWPTAFTPPKEPALPGRWRGGVDRFAGRRREVAAASRRADGAMTRWRAFAPSIRVWDEMQAAICARSLPNWPSGTSAVRGWRLFYDQALAGLPRRAAPRAAGGIGCQSVRGAAAGAPGCASSCGSAASRTGRCNYAIPLHLQPAFRGLRPETRRPAGGGNRPAGGLCSLSLGPLFMAETAVEEVAARVRDVLQ